jgi:hypothetical protein
MRAPFFVFRRDLCMLYFLFLGGTYACSIFWLNGLDESFLCLDGLDESFYIRLDGRVYAKRIVRVVVCIT